MPVLPKLNIKRPVNEKINLEFVENKFMQEVIKIVNNLKNNYDYINFQEEYTKALESYIEKLNTILSKEQND